MSSSDDGHIRTTHTREAASELAPDSGVRSAWSRASRVTSDVVDLGLVATLLRANALLIATLGFAVFALVMAHTAMSRMEFVASGRLYLGELDTRAKPTSAIEITGAAQGDVGSETEILKSRSLVARAVSRAGLNVDVVPAGWTSPRYWQWRASRRNAELLDLGFKSLLATAASLPEAVHEARKFRVRFESRSGYAIYAQGKLLGRGQLGAPASFAGLNITLLPGSERAPLAKQVFDLSVTPVDQTVDNVIDKLSVSTPRATGAALGSEPVKVLSVELKAQSPVQAAAFVRELMATYLAERQSWKTEDATAAEAFVTEQLRALRASLDDTEKKLADYRANTRVVVMDSEAKAMIEQIGKYEEQRVAARLQVGALSDMKRMLHDPHVQLEAYMLGEGTDSALQGLTSSLAKARQELTDLEQKFNPEAPDVKRQRAQVDAQREMVRNYVASRLTRAQDNLNTLHGIIGQFEEKLKTVPGAELGLASLARESEVYSRMYSYLLERQQQAGILRASTISKNRVLDRPRVPYIEDGPKLGLRISIAGLGLLLAALFVLARRLLASTVQTDSDVRVATAGVPVFAQIPELRKAKRSVDSLSLPPALRGLVGDPNSPFAEGLRTLRTNLYLCAPKHAGCAVLVTSPLPGDGKTTTALALASILAADGKEVLVIDADLRKPSHHELLGISNETGLRSVLGGQNGWREAVQPVALPFGEFYAMTAGKAAPAELLSGERIARLVRETRERFDFVIVDCASFPLVSDARALVRLCDCSLSVVRLNHTPRRLLHEHTQGMADGAGAMGLVVNYAPATSPYGYGQRRYVSTAS